MRKTLLGGVSAIAISLGAVTAASAADWVDPAPVATWTGFYVGGNFGYVWADDESIFKNTQTSNVQIDTLDGLVVGAHAGYNWQWDNYVFGLEFAASKLDLHEIGQESGTGTDQTGVIEADLETLFSIRARLGFAMGSGGDTLAYVTGGLAFFEAEYDVYDSDERTNESVSGFGGVVGGGLEHRVTSNMSVGLEGLYYFFDDTDALDLTQLASSGVTGDKVGIDDMFLIRARASFHF